MNTIHLGQEEKTPSKIICIGRNYMEHIEELQNEVPENMVIFSKPNSSISEKLASSHGQESLHFEGEICFLIDKGVFCGVGFGLDLTKRDLQSRLKSKGLPWERSKAFDGAAVFSTFVPFSGDGEDLSLQLEINGALRQHGCVQQMIYSPMQILNEIGSFTSLCDGDIIMTGTPKGVGVVATGDRFLGSIMKKGEILVQGNWVAEL